MRTRETLSEKTILYITVIELIIEKIIQNLARLFKCLMMPLVHLKNKIIHLHATRLTGSSIWVLEKIYGKEPLNTRLEQLRVLQPGTVGREIADMLDSKQYRLIPKFEDHDLKHIVLGYEMTRRDEIRMQAYLVGNGNRTLPCMIFLSIAIIYPGLWRDLIVQYQLGKKRKSIYYLRLEECMDKSLEDVKAEYAWEV